MFGPRLSDGSYPKTLATDEDSGYGKLAKVKDLEMSIPGFYLVEVDSEEQARTIAAMVPTGNTIEWRKVFPMADDQG